MMNKKAILLLSGGLDSTTTLAIAKSKCFEVYALTFNYGQRNQHEIQCARTVVEKMGVAEHKVLTIDLATFAQSPLVSDLAVPKNRDVDSIYDSIPTTYVPARNTVFLSYALAWAEGIQAHDIFLGVNALANEGYPDCRREYIDAFENMANYATQMGVEGEPLRIHTPLEQMSKAVVIKTGLELGVDYSMTTTCYDPPQEGVACTQCDACQLRLQGFMDLGMKDSIAYTSIEDFS